MQSFDDIQIDIKEVEAPVYDKYALQKQRLLFNVTRSKEVMGALSVWLSSFEGGLSKEVFLKQIAKLDFDDKIALQQIEKSKGRRNIVKRKVFRPILPEVGDVVQMLAAGNIFIAVTGSDTNIRKFVRATYQTLKDLGITYVLDLDELRLAQSSKQYETVNGILRKARDCEFLIHIGYENPQSLDKYIGEMTYSVRRYRLKNNLPIIMTYSRYYEDSYLLEGFTKYSCKK